MLQQIALAIESHLSGSSISNSNVSYCIVFQFKLLNCVTKCWKKRKVHIILISVM